MNPLYKEVLVPLPAENRELNAMFMLEYILNEADLTGVEQVRVVEWLKNKYGEKHERIG